MQEFLDKHFENIVVNRAAKDWAPSLHARPEVVAAFPVVAGLTVSKDKYCDENTIELRAETGKLMASYAGVRLPAPAPSEPELAEEKPAEAELALPNFLDPK